MPPARFYIREGSFVVLPFLFHSTFTPVLGSGYAGVPSSRSLSAILGPASRARGPYYPSPGRFVYIPHFQCNVGAGLERILSILYLLDVSKYRNKYRTESIRASWWDYTKPGCYFVTICTYGRKWFFGEVQDISMKLSPTGVLADKFWCEIFRSFSTCQIGCLCCHAESCGWDSFFGSVRFLFC